MASISDILSSVTRAHAQSDPYLSNKLLHEQQQKDQRALTRAWVAERTAPELLPWPGELVERVMKGIASQIATIEDLTASMDAGTSFTLVVLQTELERFKFMMRSFLRARIAKISTHPHYYQSTAQSTPQSTSQQQQDQNQNPLLSPSEAAFLAHHLAHRTTHYTRSFLAAFPPKLQSLAEPSSSSTSSPDGPDLDRAVFVRGLAGRSARREAGGFADGDADGDGDGVLVSCGFTGRGRGEGEDDNEEEDGGGGGGGRRGGGGGERVVRVRRGEVWVVRWAGVRAAVLRGDVELV